VYVCVTLHDTHVCYRMCHVPRKTESILTEQ
jgi:hypothetical protein